MVAVTGSLIDALSAWRHWLLAVAGLLTMLSASSAHAQSCDALLPGLKVGNSTILGSQTISTGSFTVGYEGPKIQELPRFCRVVARARPTPSSNIIIEVWIPNATTWNGKVLGTGNGGYAGSIDYRALAGGLRRGYAVANTDMGTYPASLNLNYGAGNGLPDPSSDWGYRSTHEMTLFAKAAIRLVFGKGARSAYWIGCSTGGRQGLMEAQRFPEDYDAIVAGAPGNNSTHQHASWTFMDIAGRRPGASIRPDQLSYWHSQLLSACAGKDGGAPGDAYLTNPLSCPLRPRELLCAPGQTSNCLQEAQVAALEAVYTGTRNSRTGKLIYPPYAPGADLSRYLSVANGSSTPVTTDFHRWVFGPHWKAGSFDFDRDMAAVDHKVGRKVNAMSPDLSAFARRGGKLIMYHGWSDSSISPIDTIVYYDRLSGGSMDRSAFVRLFMVPGMDHCMGGPGLDAFGQSLTMPPSSTDEDVLAALERWSDNGIAPEALVMAKAAPRGAPDNSPPNKRAQRPVCAYPGIATYDGRGIVNEATSFSCVLRPPIKYEAPAKQYLR